MRVEGSGHQCRTFLFTGDVVHAVDIVRREGTLGQVYNIGGDKEHTVLEVAETVLRVLRPGEAPSDWLEFVADRPFNDQRYCVDRTKLLALGWLQEVNLEDAIRAIAGAHAPGSPALSPLLTPLPD